MLIVCRIIRIYVYAYVIQCDCDDAEKTVSEVSVCASHINYSTNI